MSWTLFFQVCFIMFYLSFVYLLDKQMDRGNYQGD